MKTLLTLKDFATVDLRHIQIGKDQFVELSIRLPVGTKKPNRKIRRKRR